MSTTTDFNPQELLNRLRGNRKQEQQGNNNNNNNNKSNYDNQNVYTNMKTHHLIPPPPPFPPSQTSSTNNMHSTMNGHISNNPHFINTTSKSSSMNTSNGQTIKSPPITLTPNQRQENLFIRTELEKDIQRLQNEVLLLKKENEQLKLDKEDVEKQMIAQKIKSDALIVKLRGNNASLNKQLAQHTKTSYQSSLNHGGKLYPPPPSPLLSSSSSSLYPTIETSASGPMHAQPSSLSSVPPRSPTHYQSSHQHTLSPTRHRSPPVSGQYEGFRDPTFSELMRRRTPEHFDFKEGLRHSSTTKLSLAVLNPSNRQHQVKHSGNGSSSSIIQYQPPVSSEESKAGQVYSNHSSKNSSNHDGGLNYARSNNSNNNNRPLYNDSADSISDDIPVIEIDLSS